MFFWAITQPVMVIYYRRFRTTYRFHFQGSLIQLPLDWRWDRWVVPKRRWEISTDFCVIAQKSAVLKEVTLLETNKFHNIWLASVSFLTLHLVLDLHKRSKHIYAYVLIMPLFDWEDFKFVQSRKFTAGKIVWKAGIWKIWPWKSGNDLGDVCCYLAGKLLPSCPCFKKKM